MNFNRKIPKVLGNAPLLVFWSKNWALGITFNICLRRNWKLLNIKSSCLLSILSFTGGADLAVLGLLVSRVEKKARSFFQCNVYLLHTSSARIAKEFIIFCVVSKSATTFFSTLYISLLCNFSINCFLWKVSSRSDLRFQRPVFKLLEFILHSKLIFQYFLQWRYESIWGSRE